MKNVLSKILYHGWFTLLSAISIGAVLGLIWLVVHVVGNFPYKLTPFGVGMLMFSIVSILIGQMCRMYCEDEKDKREREERWYKEMLGGKND